MRFPLAFAAILAAATAFAADRKPNVIVIVGDDMGYGDVGVHGCKDIPTPHLDALAKSGTRCSSGYISCPVCSPTRAGLLTGRYQQRFGHEFNPGGVNSVKGLGMTVQEKTLADRLKSAGYKTGWVGKWHLGGDEKFQPKQRGFDESFGFLGGAHDYLKSGTGEAAIFRDGKRVEIDGYLTDAFGREAVSFIDRHAKEPFFLYLAFNAVHTPMQATDKYLKRFDGIPDEKRRTYAAMMSAMDDAVGEVIRKVKSAGIEEDTLLFFISDNGGPPENGSRNGPLFSYKTTTWEGGIRVPFFVSWKGKVPAGKEYASPVIQLDISATALAAAGVEREKDSPADGVNLLPHLAGEAKEPPHTALFWRFGQQMAVRAGDWKLVKGNEGGKFGVKEGEAKVEGAKLFNLADDIGEKTDLAEKNPEKVKELAALWAKWNAELVPPTWVSGGVAKPKVE